MKIQKTTSQVSCFLYLHVFSSSHNCTNCSGLSHVAVEWKWTGGLIGGFVSFVFNGGGKYIAISLYRAINDEFKLFPLSAFT